MKAQAALSCGEWTWASAKLIPEFKTTDLTEDENVPGYKKVHVEIDMTEFETWDNTAGANKPYPFEQITPIKAVIPCFAGSGSTYEGDLYLDNLEVWAVNGAGGDIPDVTEDLFLELDASAWTVSEDAYQYTGESKIGNKTIGDKKFLVATMDYSNDSSQGWSEAKFEYTHPEAVTSLQGYNAFKADVYYKPTDKTAGNFGIKLFANTPAINSDAALPAGEAVDIPGLEGYYKAEFILDYRFPAGAFTNLTFGFVGKNTDFAGDIYLDNMRFTKVTAEDVYVDSTILPKKGPGIQVVDDGRNIQTASGEKFAIAEEVAMVDAEATPETKNLYAYLKAVGESDSVIFGHQNDTHHKAGSKGDEFTNSDTKDLTGSIAGVVGIDTLSLTGNEASTWDAPEAERIANVANITREAAAEGAIITLSAHMPNFELIDQRVKNFEVSGGTTNETLGYWIADDGSKQYNFSGYTPGTTSGNIVSRIMPGQDLNYLYTDYLDLIADYAKAVEGDGITILFRPLHENTGSWFWWGAAFCDEQAYINLYRYTVDYLKETKNVHNIIYVYGPGSEAANVGEYSARYPGDAYVDMIGYDLYHSNPSPENEAGYLQSIKKQNTILRDFATAHNKLYAITETGVADQNAAGESIALQRTGNKVMDWYMQLLDEISNDGVSYFLVWANFSENGSFYLPYVVEKKEDGYLHGHEMMDEFIKFYNDDRSVFATDMNGEFKKVSGVTNTTQAGDVSGYFIAPQSGDRILPDENNPKTRIAAKVSGVDSEAEDLSVQFIVSTEFDEVVLQANYNAQEAVWEAELEDSALISMGEAMGTITLCVNDVKISEITARFNMVEAVQDDMVPEDFEGYNGNSQQLGLTWATNKASGSEINLSLTNDSEKVFGGDYGLQMDITLAASDAWAGATKSFNADWSMGNALEFYTIPETNGQKIVVQVTAGNQVFEVYLQEYDNYTMNAADGFPVKVTIPFSAFVGRDNKDAKFDPSKVESIGLWCNAIAKEGVMFPLSTTLYYDEFKVVTTDKTAVGFAPTVYKGIWFKEIPAQTYTGKAIKPDVQVYDDAKLLTPKRDYTVSYKNNTKAGRADVIIKGKGNYSETIIGHFTILPKEIGELTITAPEYIIYNGREQNIAVTVKDGKKKLGTKNDYAQTITFSDGSEQGQTAEVQKAKEEGIYKIKITMKGNYIGETELTCKVVKDKDLLSKATVMLPSKSLDYKDGKEVRFDESQIVVKLKGKVIPQKEEDGTVNYAVSYENNKQVGTASVVIAAGAGSKYVGSARKTFTIKGITFSANTIDIAGFETKRLYTGKAVYQTLVLKDKTSESDVPLKKNVDYSITYVKNVNAGTATMTITGLNKYSGTIKKNFTIEKVTLNDDMLQHKVITVKQNRAGAAPDVELVYEGRTLIKDQDYKLTYTGNKNVTSGNRQAWINIAGKGNFKGSLKKAVELKIEPKSWDSGEITVEVPDMKYSANKAEYKPNPVVYDNGKKLTKNKDYTVEYASNKKEDIREITDKGHEAKVIITLSGSDYVVGEAGEAKEFNFRIIGKLISEAKVKINPQKKQFFSQYGTKLEKTDLIVTYKNDPVGVDEYDIVSYSKNDKKGKATLVLAGKGQYGGTKKVTFTINARGMESNLAEEFKNVVAEITALMMEAFD
ncbi:MAG: glycoside hydrolase family 26 protein [Lachnospiraceae bacterium]|nr:glycoside hydrolase family 26 protein [Lachnospiraceae bacterium]